jgi:hypothetical protein
MYRTLLVVLAWLAVGDAAAGTACSLKTPAPQAIKKGLELGLTTRSALEASNAQVAIVGRIGSDLSEYGLRYSHAGFAWRDHPQGRWLVVHMLNECGTAHSGLFDEGLGNFFLDDPLIYEALLVIPSAQTQQKLARALASELPLRLYEPAYSLISNPWSTRYQNSNQWLLEVLAVSLSERPQGTRGQAQALLRSTGYAPSVIHLPPLKRLGARLFAANTRFDDHTMEEWSSSHYNIVSVESIGAFLKRVDRETVTAVVATDATDRAAPHSKLTTTP